VNDTTPPRVAITTPARRTIAVSLRDAGAGVDPESVTAAVDGSNVRVRLAKGRFTIRALPGTHRVVVSASDYQEAKNMEDVVKIRPNTTRVSRIVVVR
jgi:hypothetical protein